MNCPYCGGTGKKYKHIKDGSSTYKQHKCKRCGELFYMVETFCAREDFLIRQRNQQNEQYRKRCARAFGVT